MLTAFRIVAFAEAISYLVLLGLAMPLKYAGGYLHATFWPGMVHGVLFIAYFVVLVLLSRTHALPRKLTALAASLVPAGPFLVDPKIRSAAAEST